MMLGKRSRQPIKRTTSMTGITVDVVDHHQDPIISHPPPQIHPLHESPDANSRDSGTTAAAPFLRACWLCNRRL
ncbi:hypothetical protein Golob_022753, partial [Gossypium lobatum]|nr:hypothetical protein [Gossypium lobatum]